MTKATELREMSDEQLTLYCAALNNDPDNEFDVEQSAASRKMIEEYVRKTRTDLWIEHDFRANAALKKSPAYYE